MLKPVQRPFDRLYVSRVHKTNDPVQRFVEVVRYYLSGWHIKPKVKTIPFGFFFFPTVEHSLFSSCSCCRNFPYPFLAVGSQKTLQSHPRRAFPLSLQLPRRCAGLLCRWASVASPAHIGLLLCEPREPDYCCWWPKTQVTLPGE